MRDMTASNLRNAHGGESMAHMRYLIWGEKAEEEGYSNVARLFQAIAEAERVHATNHFTELEDEEGGSLCASMAEFGIGTTSENLQGGIDGETFEINEMYPAYLNVAKDQKETGAIKSFHYAYSAEKIHAQMFKEAKKSVDSGNDPELDDVQVCEVCGYTAEGDRPENCPICGATDEEFVTFD